MNGRRVHRWVLEVAVVLLTGAVIMLLNAIVIVDLLRGPAWAAIVCSLIGNLVAGWRIAGWNERQDELEAHRAEVDR